MVALSLVLVYFFVLVYPSKQKSSRCVTRLIIWTDPSSLTQAQ